MYTLKRLGFFFSERIYCNILVNSYITSQRYDVTLFTSVAYLLLHYKYSSIKCKTIEDIRYFIVDLGENESG